MSLGRWLSVSFIGIISLLASTLCDYVVLLFEASPVLSETQLLLLPLLGSFALVLLVLLEVLQTLFQTKIATKSSDFAFLVKQKEFVR